MTIELNDKSNNIIVSAFDDSDKSRIKSAIKNKEYCNIVCFESLSSPIVFDDYDIDSSNSAATSYSVFSGTPLYSSSYGYSAGFCHSSTGFYMCGHGLTVGTVIKSTSGTVIGTVTKQKFSGNADAAYVSISNSSWSSVKKMIDNTSYNAGLMYSRSYVAGTSVKMSGSKSGISSGTILSSSVSVICNNVTLTNQVKASYHCKSGDSGAGVFNMSNIALGIQSSGSGYNSSGLYYSTSYFSKYENVVAIWEHIYKTKKAIHYFSSFHCW